MFKPLLLLVLINAGISFAQVNINVRHSRAPDTTWAVDAVTALEEAFDAFWPHHFLIAQSWINSFTLLHPGVYDVAFGHNLTTITNSTVLIELEAWDLHPKTLKMQEPPRPPPTDGPNPPPTDGPSPPPPPTDGPNPPSPASVEQLLKENMPRQPPTDGPNPPPPTDGPNPPPTDGPNPPPPQSSVEQPLKDEDDPRTYWTIILNA